VVGELVGSAGRRGLWPAASWRIPGPGGPAEPRLGLRVTGQSAVGGSQGEPRAVGHVATSRGWRTRFGSWGRRRWVVLAVLLVVVGRPDRHTPAAVPVVASISPALVGGVRRLLIDPNRQCRRPQRVCSWATSVAHQHLFFHRFARGRMKAESRQ
jgi:hypothetical protein